MDNKKLAVILIDYLIEKYDQSPSQEGLGGASTGNSENGSMLASNELSNDLNFSDFPTESNDLPSGGGDFFNSGGPETSSPKPASDGNNQSFPKDFDDFDFDL